MKFGTAGLRVALTCLGFALLAGGQGCTAEGDSAQKEKKKRPAMADSTDGARMDVLRWLVKLEPAFEIFQARFKQARPMFVREDAYSPRISVIVNLATTRYPVTFIASAEFSDDLRRASKSRIDAFFAVVPIAGRTYTLELPPRDMKAFAADPDGYVEKKAAAIKPK